MVRVFALIEWLSSRPPRNLWVIRFLPSPIIGKGNTMKFRSRSTDRTHRLGSLVLVGILAAAFSVVGLSHASANTGQICDNLTSSNGHISWRQCFKNLGGGNTEETIGSVVAHVSGAFMSGGLAAHTAGDSTEYLGFHKNGTTTGCLGQLDSFKIHPGGSLTCFASLSFWEQSSGQQWDSVWVASGGHKYFNDHFITVNS
jgi:hypothetical protein